MFAANFPLRSVDGKLYPCGYARAKILDEAGGPAGKDAPVFRKDLKWHDKSVEPSFYSDGTKGSRTSSVPGGGSRSLEDAERQHELASLTIDTTKTARPPTTSLDELNEDSDDGNFGEWRPHYDVRFDTPVSDSCNRGLESRGKAGARRRQDPSHPMRGVPPLASPKGPFSFLFLDDGVGDESAAGAWSSQHYSELMAFPSTVSAAQELQAQTSELGDRVKRLEDKFLDRALGTSTHTADQSVPVKEALPEALDRPQSPVQGDEPVRVLTASAEVQEMLGGMMRRDDPGQSQPAKSLKKNRLLRGSSSHPNLPSGAGAGASGPKQHRRIFEGPRRMMKGASPEQSPRQSPRTASPMPLQEGQEESAEPHEPHLSRGELFPPNAFFRHGCGLHHARPCRQFAGPISRVLPDVSYLPAFV